LHGAVVSKRLGGRHLELPNQSIRILVARCSALMYVFLNLGDLSVVTDL
jgi:hypothetical protein